MRPIGYRRDAGENRLSERKAHAPGIIFRCEELTEHAADIKITGVLSRPGHVARHRSPHVPVSFDEAWERNHIVGVNNLCLRGRKIPPDSDDRAAANVNVAASDFADLRVHREKMRVLDDELTTLRQSA